MSMINVRKMPEDNPYFTIYYFDGTQEGYLELMAIFKEESPTWNGPLNNLEYWFRFGEDVATFSFIDFWKDYKGQQTYINVRYRGEDFKIEDTDVFWFSPHYTLTGRYEKLNVKNKYRFFGMYEEVQC